MVIFIDGEVKKDFPFEIKETPIWRPSRGDCGGDIDLSNSPLGRSRVKPVYYDNGGDIDLSDSPLGRSKPRNVSYDELP